MRGGTAAFMRTVFAIAGATFGLFLARVFAFDYNDGIVWEYFWAHLFAGDVCLSDFPYMLCSDVFAKSLLGLAAGAVCGYAIRSIGHEER